MTPCQNSINELLLKPETYPEAGRTTFFLSQSAVDKVIAQGMLPQIECKEAVAEADAPKIALLLTRDKLPVCRQTDYSLPATVLESLILSGGKPCFMVYEKIAEQLETINPDGIFLPGGDFALPTDWLEQPPAHSANPLRVDAYIACLKYAKEHKKPFLGVCAGEQMLAGFCGAKIIRVDNHRGIVKDYAHKIEIKQESLLYQVTGVREAAVNSNHSEAVSAVHSGGAVVSAIAADGVVEAIEPKEPWADFVLGIQSHPEYFVKTGDVFAAKIFKAFVEACKNV